MSSHLRHTVSNEDLEEAVHSHLVDGKIVIPVVAKLKKVGNELVPTEYTLLLYDPEKFDKEREAQIEQRHRTGSLPARC